MRAASSRRREINDKKILLDLYPCYRRFKFPVNVQNSERKRERVSTSEGREDGGCCWGGGGGVGGVEERVINHV